MRQAIVKEGLKNFHRHSDQWLFVLAGAGLAIVEGKRRPLRNGSLLLIEHGERHEIRNTGRKLLVTLNIYSPLAYSQKGSLLTTGKPAGSGWSARAMPSHGPHHHACEAPIVALVHREGEKREVGISRYSMLADGITGECAVTVDDEWQSKGLGTLLMRRLIDVARRHGVHTLISMDTAGNWRMHELANDLGFTCVTDPEDPTQVTYRLAL